MLNVPKFVRIPLSKDKNVKYNSLGIRCYFFLKINSIWKVELIMWCSELLLILGFLPQLLMSRKKKTFPIDVGSSCFKLTNF